MPFVFYLARRVCSYVYMPSPANLGVPRSLPRAPGSGGCGPLLTTSEACPPEVALGARGVDTPAVDREARLGAGRGLRGALGAWIGAGGRGARTTTSEACVVEVLVRLPGLCFNRGSMVNKEPAMFSFSRPVVIQCPEDPDTLWVSTGNDPSEWTEYGVKHWYHVNIDNFGLMIFCEWDHFWLSENLQSWGF